MMVPLKTLYWTRKTPVLCLLNPGPRAEILRFCRVDFSECMDFVMKLGQRVSVLTKFSSLVFRHETAASPGGRRGFYF